MSTRSKSKREYIVDSLLGFAGVGVAWFSAKILFVELGWRERGRDFESDVIFVAPIACILGVYVFVQASGRLTSRKEARERKLAEFHEKAESARAASKQT
jgi:hypothetical protein